VAIRFADLPRLDSRVGWIASTLADYDAGVAAHPMENIRGSEHFH
jgi:hypothetical protein